MCSRPTTRSLISERCSHDRDQEAQANRTRVIGDMYPGGLLTKEGCMRRCGIGRKLLAEARQSGMVTPITIGDSQRMYYRTSELIAWIESHAKGETS